MVDRTSITNRKGTHNKNTKSRKLSFLLKFIVAFICCCSVVTITLHAFLFRQYENVGKDEDSIHKLDSNQLTHHCVNKDFQPKHKVSIWTMLNDNPAYITSAVKLGRALKKHTVDTEFDLIVMTLETKPLSDASMKELAGVGFINCAVSPIRPTHLEGKTRKDLQEKFGVLHVFAMTVYETVLFIDADTFVQGPIGECSLFYYFTF